MQSGRTNADLCIDGTCADPENFLRGVQIPRRGLTENFNMAKINNLAIPGAGRGVGVGSRPPVPLPPLDPPMWKERVFSLHFLSSKVQLCTPYPLQMAA